MQMTGTIKYPLELVLQTSTLPFGGSCNLDRLLRLVRLRNRRQLDRESAMCGSRFKFWACRSEHTTRPGLITRTLHTHFGIMTPPAFSQPVIFDGLRFDPLVSGWRFLALLGHVIFISSVFFTFFADMNETFHEKESVTKPSVFI